MLIKIFFNLSIIYHYVRMYVKNKCLYNNVSYVMISS